MDECDKVALGLVVPAIPLTPVEVTPAEQRLLDLLAQPLRAGELAKRLGVSRQRVRQIVLALVAKDQIRVGDPDQPTLIVARRDDPSVLLTYPQERVLSSLTEGKDATGISIGRTRRMEILETQRYLMFLVREKLVSSTEWFGREYRYRLTGAGRSHAQYRTPAKRSKIASLGVKSDRIFQVLTYLLDHGPARTRDIGDSLRIPRISMNALMQYLKRKSLVYKAGAGQTDPFDLTAEGRVVQQAMTLKQS